MFFKRSKVLTGLVTFTMAAAVMGGPVQAMDLSARRNASATLNPITGNVITPDNAQAELIADAVLSIVGPGHRKIDNFERKEIVNSASEKSTLNKEDKIELAVAAPNVYLNIHTDASLGSEVIGKLYSNDVAKIIQDNGGDWVKVKSGSCREDRSSRYTSPPLSASSCSMYSTAMSLETCASAGSSSSSWASTATLSSRTTMGRSSTASSASRHR